MVAGSLTLSSLFYNVGPMCLSVNKIFQAFDYHELLKQYKEKRKEYTKHLKSKNIEGKAKDLLGNSTQ